MLPRTLFRADLILVPSHYVKTQIADLFPGVEEKVRVLALPLSDTVQNACSTKTRSNLSDDVEKIQKSGVMFSGDLGPKKNFGFLLECYASLPVVVRQAHPLIVCGNRLGQNRPYASLVQSLGLEDDVRFLGYLNEGDLTEWYRRARVLAYPSLVEGFGLPPLEAMAMGTPAIVSDRGSLPEIAGSYGAVVSTLDTQEFGAALLRLLTDDDWYSTLVARGRAATSQTCWKVYAQELLNLYESLL